MAGRLLPRMFDVALDANGNPLSGAKLYTYVNTTTTPKPTYTTSALNVAHPNPIVADSAGRFPDIWADDNQTFRVKLTDSGGVQVFQADDMITLGSNPSGAISRDFGVDGRFAISASGGVASFEAGDPSPDNTGGKGRSGGWAGTQADTWEIDAAATSVTGTLAVASNSTVGGNETVTGSETIGGNLSVTGTGAFGGAVSVGGALTLADGSVVTNAEKPIVESGLYYPVDPIAATTSLGAAAMVANRIYWFPFSRPLTTDAFVFKITGAVVGNARVGIYTSDPTTGLPKTLIEGSAAISTNATGVTVNVWSSTHVISTRVWLAILSDATPTISVFAETSSYTLDGRLFGQSTLGTSTYGRYSTFAYAALPATAPAMTGGLNADMPYLALRAA